MASIYFKGRIDFETLSMSEISAINAAVATLETMAKKHGFEFVSGPSRKGSPRPDMAGPRSTTRPKAQRRLLLALISRDHPMTVREIAETTGLKEGTINPHLSALYSSGIIHRIRQRIPAPEGFGRKSTTAYSLTEDGIAVAEEIRKSGETLID